MRGAVETRGHRHPVAAHELFRKVLWASAWLALSCGEVTETTVDEVASVGVTPPTSTITVGAQVPLQAVVQDAAGNRITTASVFWSVKDPSIASVSSAGVVTGLAIGATEVAASVAGKSAIAAITVQRVPVASVVVRPTTAEAETGGRVQFTATVFDANQRALTDRSISWTSSNEAVATVNTAGMATAVGPGVATITATSEGKSDAARLTVTQAPVATVEVTPNPLAMSVGQSTQLTATPRDANGAAITGRSATWSSSNTSVATVTEQGVVRAVATGTATITATIDSKTGSAALTVSEFAVASVSVAPANATLLPHGSIQLTATVRDVTGAIAPNRVIAWSSSNTSVVTVSQSGVATGVGAGSATITAVSEGQSGTASILVLPAGVTTVEVSPTTATLAVRQTVTLAVTLKDQDGLVLTGRPITFTSSNPEIATVSTDGTVTGIAPGTATIVVSSEGKSASATATVTAFGVGSVTVQPSAASLAIGQTTTLTATVRDVNGTVLTDRPVTWTTNNGAVATVTSSGLVAAVSSGSATITATADGKSGSATITVSAIPVASVTVTPSSVTLVEFGTTTLTATTKDASGNTLSGRVVTWTTSASNIATVSPDGVVTAVSPGTATITATSEGKSGTATVTVTAATVATVTVSPSPATVLVGGTVTLTATAKDASGNTLNGRTFIWTTGNYAIASVSSSGVVTGVAAGTATITAATGGKAGTATVTVTVAPVATVTVQPSTANIFVLGTVTLSAVTKDAAGNTLTGRSVTWSSSNPTVATVTQSGVVTGVAPGTATITATSEGKSGTATVTVSLAPVGSVVISPSSATVASGSTTTLTATVKDQNGNIVTDRTVTWTSSNTAVATVSSSGVVTGALVGTATITASVEGKTATSTVTVNAGPVATIRVSPSSASVAVGATVSLTAQAFDAAGNPVSGTSFNWSSSDPSIASVSGDGRVTGKKQGSVTITASAGGKSGSATVTVTK